MKAVLRAPLVLALVLAAACGPSPRAQPGDDEPPGDDGPVCELRCSDDLHAVVDCNGNVTTQCAGTDACDANTLTCRDACAAAESNKRSVGCDYYAVDMDVTQPTYCFAAFVANTWNAPAHISVSYGGNALPVANFVKHPVGSGPSLTYTAYDPAVGLAPGEVAILFLSGDAGNSPRCPGGSAVPDAGRAGTGVAQAFHITTDVPVVAYQINPFGGGSTAVTAASLLIPTSAWDVDYIAVNVSPSSAGSPSLDIIAREDDTVVTLTPVATVAGGGPIPGGPAGQPLQFTLAAGQYAQITQAAELTGSTVSATKPIGFLAGQTCMNMPVGTSFCDHGEQMVPPVRALANRYAGAMYRPRVPSETSTFWRLIGAVDGTQLTYSTDVGGPATLNRGQAVTFQTGTPFVVTSQDGDHPFMLFAYMTGSQFVMSGYGDPDFVYMVPPEQYLRQYVFFADPTYPETNLVVIRARGDDGEFHPVTLPCAGALQGWTPITADYELARVDLMTGNFMPVGACSTGRHEITSTAPFGLWVWGWGTPLTTSFTSNVSYGYPGGMNVKPINSVVFE